MNRQKSFRAQSAIILAMLALQYILGMYANLYVSFPEGASGGTAWKFAWSQVGVAIHIILGVLLVIAAIIFLVRASRPRNVKWQTPAVLGLIGIVGAASAGPLFISSQDDAWSYFMSLFFVLAFFAYLWGYMRKGLSGE